MKAERKGGEAPRD